MFAVIGLGNPGERFRYTRHNVGFDTIECLAERFNVKISKIKHKSIYGQTKINDENILLVKPQTFMNNSGICALEICNYYNISPENIIVIYDDIDIEFGSLRIRPKGSAGSHNGMKSIIYHLQCDDFPRVRIGIGRPNEGLDLADFVLNRFQKEDREIIDETIKKAADAVETIINYSVNKAMNEYNR